MEGDIRRACQYAMKQNNNTTPFQNHHSSFTTISYIANPTIAHL
jgi:hypothetical protein